MIDADVCPECAELEQASDDLWATVMDAFHGWVQEQPDHAVEFSVATDALARVAADTIRGMSEDLEDRNQAAAVTILMVLEGSGCDVWPVLEFVREQMAAVPVAGNA